MVVDLISLNKYVLTLIILQGSPLVYNSLARFFFRLLAVLSIWRVTPKLEKILLLLRPTGDFNFKCIYYCGSWAECHLHSIRELFFHKFVLSSIIRCLKIPGKPCIQPLKVSLFSLKVLFHTWLSPSPTHNVSKIELFGAHFTLFGCHFTIIVHDY